MNKEKEFVATVHFRTVRFSVFQCDTVKDAERKAADMAQDLAECMGYDASVDHVEVEEV